MSDYQPIINALIGCDMAKTTELVNLSLTQGIDAKDILNQGLIPAMDIVGQKMETGEMFIPEVLMAAQVMSSATEILKPTLAKEDSDAKGTVIIGTVKGDLHDIGKNLVGMMMESGGLEVHNLGVDVEPERFAAQVQEKKAGILCLSALLTTTMPMMQKTIDILKDKGLRDQVKVMIGGAPVTQTYADQIGADAYASDAGSAARLAKSLI
ncbi:Trimethylamine corrinoid protein 1 [Desulfonema limicola]|uniref:Trimethylamine corrinoid protein 1 n=1 Tax=Desulfonema limicola TaxID=45656 RepID=A0A975B556_9BACT|nr:corrinoid protein [Desulfonema limicola]QTA78985.1 Trimethylamine corrinoid protein 1 [Desulfonema limicola]